MSHSEHRARVCDSYEEDPEDLELGWIPLDKGLQKPAAIYVLEEQDDEPEPIVVLLKSELDSSLHSRYLSRRWGGYCSAQSRQWQLQARSREDHGGRP